ncbi:hypothetical protein C5688_13705 [Methylocystis sp. MitZ-2018]|nr:hypothetical protein C5688_13705 [Methylocystis sp. MitZ-2018]
MRQLFCADDEDAIYILRGLPKFSQLPYAPGREEPVLVDAIMDKGCPVSATLTEADKAKLLQIKQQAEKLPAAE